MTEELDLYMKLFERCPEMRPRRESGCHTHRLVLRTSTSGWKFPAWDLGQSMDEDSALALCRCAVEDWLAVQCDDALYVGAYVLSATNEPRWQVTGYEDESADITTFSETGPTIHHALCAAANFIADSNASNKAQTGGETA